MNFDDVVQSFKLETETMSLPIMSDWFRRECYYYCVLQNPSSPTNGLVTALQSN